MNGQPKRPENWKEWVEYLKKAVLETEMNLDLLKAQLKIALEKAR